MSVCQRRVGQPCNRGPRLHAARPGLRSWSVKQPEPFWSAVWRFCDIRAARPADRVLVDRDKMPGARWFDGAQLNFAENLLRSDDDTPALIARDERGRRRELSWRQLRE